jgi:multiple sugar transport system substrate-binding protein
MRRRSVFVWPNVLAILAVVVAACSSPSTPAPPGTPPPAGATSAPAAAAATKAPQPVELRFAWWGSQDRHNRTIKAIELFQQRYPYITITYEFAGFQEHFTKMATQATGGNLPDLMQQDYAFLTQWVGNNQLMPLDEYVNDHAINLTEVPKRSIDGGRINGKLYAVNLGNNSQTMVLDVDAFQKANVPLPPTNWTWDDFEQIAMTIHSKLGILGAGAALGSLQLWKSLELGFGEWGYSSDGKSLGFTDDQRYIDYLKMLLRLQDAGALLSQQEDIANHRAGNVEARPIVAGRAAMEQVWSNQLVAVWNAAGSARNFKLAMLPRAKGAIQAENYLKPSQFISITAKAKHPKEAAMFIDFITNDVEANKILLGERGVPISPKIQEAIRPLLTPPQVETQTYISLVEKEASPLPPPDPATDNKLDQNVFLPQLADPVLLKQIAPEPAVAQFRKDATLLLTGP